MTRTLIKLFIKNRDDLSNPGVRFSYGMLGGITGICCNLILFVIKLLAGILSGSISIIADALNNLSDMGSSTVTLLGFKMANKPADNDHPFGHGRMEYMSAFIVAALIILVGFELLKSSVQKIISPGMLNISIITFIILGVSALIKFWMFLFNRKLGRIINSGALAATARDSINDVITTSTIIVSMAIQYFTDINLDPYAGIAVAIFILYSGYMTGKEALDPLLGAPPEQDLTKRLEELIASFDVFAGTHDLIVHNYGPNRCFASIHVEVPQNIDIVYCHEQIDLCERMAAERLALELVIHMDPIDTDNQTLKAVRNQLAEQIRELDPSMTIHDFRMTPRGQKRTNLIFDVVVPSGFRMTDDEIRNRINELSGKIDKTYCCVINIDHDFTGK